MNILKYLSNFFLFKNKKSSYVKSTCLFATIFNTSEDLGTGKNKYNDNSFNHSMYLSI